MGIILFCPVLAWVAGGGPRHRTANLNNNTLGEICGFCSSSGAAMQPSRCYDAGISRHTSDFH